MATPLQQSRIVRITLMNDESILVEFSNGTSALVSSELLKQMILLEKDSVIWSNGENGE